MTVFLETDQGEYVLHVDPVTKRIFDTKHNRKVDFCSETWEDLKESILAELDKRNHVPVPPQLPKHVLASIGAATKEYKEHTRNISEKIEKPDAL